MTAALRVWFVILFFATGVQAQTPEPLVLYDDFSGERIAPEKWFGGGGGQPLDVRRGLHGSRLRLSSRSYARTDSDEGSVFAQVFLGFANPLPITAIAVTARVRDFEVPQCATNHDPGFVAAQLFGTFFNAEGATPNSHVNDVAVAIDIVRSAEVLDTERLFQINAAVLHCRNANCSDVTVLNAQTLGSVRRGDDVRLQVRWEPANDRFAFQRDDEAEAFATYIVPDAAPPGLSNKLLGVNTGVPNCSTEPRPSGLITVLVDEVFVNQSAIRSPR